MNTNILRSILLGIRERQSDIRTDCQSVTQSEMHNHNFLDKKMNEYTKQSAIHNHNDADMEMNDCKQSVSQSVCKSVRWTEIHSHNLLKTN